MKRQREGEGGGEGGIKVDALIHNTWRPILIDTIQWCTITSKHEYGRSEFGHV